MGRKVYTREIMEALEIPNAPITADTILELEQAIEKRWLEQFTEYQKAEEERFERRLEITLEHENQSRPFDLAYAKIGQAVLSQLHNQGVVIPSLMSQAALDAGRPEQETVIELVDTVMHYTSEGRNFEILKQAIMDNDMLKGEWDRFCMFLRLAE